MSLCARSTRPSNRSLINVFSVLYTYNIRSKAWCAACELDLNDGYLLQDTELIVHLLYLSRQMYRHPQADDTVMMTLRWLILVWTECLRDLPFLILHTHNNHLGHVCQVLDNLATYSMHNADVCYTLQERINFLYQFVIIRQWRKLTDRAQYHVTFHRQTLDHFLSDCVLSSEDCLTLSLMIVLGYYWQPDDAELPHWTNNNYAMCLKRLSATAVELEKHQHNPPYIRRFKDLLMDLIARSF